MNIFKLIFGESQDHDLNPDDVKNIKSLFTHLNAVVDFLNSRNEITHDIVSKFKTHQQALSRILKINSLAIYFQRHITGAELESLLKIIVLSNEIIRIGRQKEHFLSSEEQIMRIHKLIQKITRDNTRWIKKS